MRHLVGRKKLGRTSEHRRALFRNMVTDLLDHGRIVTTLPKAKSIRPIAEKMITLGKRQSLHARRQAYAFIRRAKVVQDLFSILAPRFADRHGGYTRIIRLGHRDGDGAAMALIEVLGTEFKPRKKDKEDKEKTTPSSK
ncbi:MAG: 50S ribosomal protein L17 [Acidobacteria bacterium]|nr:50S ribosomal protein L17 [Acidobacteriota bacterium]MBI3657646.1 50S ribosomal protein L17 [Acidobacteriota bacterium]